MHVCRQNSTGADPPSSSASSHHSGDSKGLSLHVGFAVVENPPANAGDVGSIPKSGRSPRVGNGNPLQYSGLENLIDRGAWQASSWGPEEPDTTEHIHTPHAPYCAFLSSQVLGACPPVSWHQAADGGP